MNSLFKVHLVPYFNILTQILLRIQSAPICNINYLEIFRALFSKEEIELISIYRASSNIDHRFNDLYLHMMEELEEYLEKK